MGADEFDVPSKWKSA